VPQIKRHLPRIAGFEKMAIDFSSVVTFLNAISAISVIFGAIFIVFQLRQNAKLIQLQVTENRSNIAFALLEKITDESFASRRKKMRDSIKAAVASNWKGFDDSLEDFESRNFGGIYDLIGQLARDGVIDLNLIKNALRYLVVTDWDIFEPLAKHVMENLKLSTNPWDNFEWLANEIQTRLT